MSQWERSTVDDERERERHICHMLVYEIANIVREWHEKRRHFVIKEETKERKEFAWQLVDRWWLSLAKKCRLYAARQGGEERRGEERRGEKARGGEKVKRVIGWTSGSREHVNSTAGYFSSSADLGEEGGKQVALLGCCGCGCCCCCCICCWGVCFVSLLVAGIAWKMITSRVHIHVNCLLW